MKPGAIDLTQLLRAWHRGDAAAGEEAWAAVYERLRRLARHVRRGRRQGGTGTTTIVHEVYLRLLNNGEIEWREREHFFAVAARAMRFLLADQARQRLASKRDAEVVSEIPLEVVDSRPLRSEEILAVHQALDRLEAISPRQAKLVELHYFSGFTLEESAEILQISRRTAVRDWKAVRTWLHGELEAHTKALV